MKRFGRFWSLMGLFLLLHHNLFAQAPPKTQTLHLTQSQYKTLLTQVQAEAQQGRAELLLVTQVGEDPEKDQLPPESYPEETYRPQPAFNPPSLPLDLSLRVGIHGSGNQDDALLILVVVGLVIVAAFLIYSVAYLYGRLTYQGQQSRWLETGIGFAGFYNGKEQGGLSGLRLAMGLKERGFDWGLAGELGRIDARLGVAQSTETLHLTGLYGAAGPLLLYNSSARQRFYLELLAGTTQHKEVHILAKAGAGIRRQVSEHLSLGAEVGSLMVSLKPAMGLVREKNDFNLILGLDLAWRF